MTDNVDLSALQAMVQRVLDQQVTFARETRENLAALRGEFDLKLEKVNLRIDALSARIDRIDTRMTRMTKASMASSFAWVLSRAPSPP
jgi:hypothetical protein